VTLAPQRLRIFGLILAGGAGRRMGGADKALLLLRGRPLLSHVADRFAPQVEGLALSANDDPHRFAAFGLPVLPDIAADSDSSCDGDSTRNGPMAGLLAGLLWARDQGASHLATVSVDTPFLPCDLVPRLLLATLPGSGAAIAESAGRRHPTCGLWPVTLALPLGDALAAGERRIGQWAEASGARTAGFNDTPDPFFNLNTPEDLARAERLLEAGEA
jgi:molybdopterin-guanine dinucleotide biosynthesis protein A